MTRRLPNLNLDHAKSGKRMLKPVIEKKRRDRINQSLGELRALLLNCTNDVRLQNPKMEKAEILDMAVEYLQKWTERKSTSNDSTNGCSGQMRDPCAPLVGLPHSESSAPTLFAMETAGFQQCMTQLAGYMHKITPAQRASLIQELRSHTESQCNPKPGQHPPSSITDLNQSSPATQATKGPDAASSVDEVVHRSKRKRESPKFILLSHQAMCQPGTLSPTICHSYLSPPLSPYLPSSSSPYVTPPPFPTLACHFSFSPSLSPLSSNTSFSTPSPSHSLPTMPAPVSFSPTLPLSASPTFHFPSLATTLRSPVPVPREGLPEHSPSSVWRPWF